MISLLQNNKRFCPITYFKLNFKDPIIEDMILTIDDKISYGGIISKI